MTRHVWIDGTRVALAPGALLGQGGEAEVYDLGDGRVVKWWKPADHPDFVGLPDAQRAAEARIAAAPAKLRALPGNLPAAVVAPCGLALATKRGAVCGYVMSKVAGTALHDHGEPRWRREHPVAGGDIVAALLALHDAIAGLHRAGVIIGDCNDLNVLVDGRRVHLIDVDSFQYGGFSCSMWSERFIDPRLCDAQQLVPVRPHDEDSDWFAFAVMVCRTLLCVGPWGGVARSGAPGARALRRHSVFATDVVYPRAARPLATLPDDLLDTLRAIFERDVRGAFPRATLERLRLSACTACGEEHARVRCPACQVLAHVPPARVHGRLRYQRIAIEEVAVATRRITHAGSDVAIAESRVTHAATDVAIAASRVTHAATDVAIAASRVTHAANRVTPAGTVWLRGDALMRTTRLGPERIGSVLAGQTHAWVGQRLGIGFYRAGGYVVGFVFRPDRGVLDDRVALPRIRGQLVSAHAAVGDDRAWLFLTCSDAGRLVTTCVVVGAEGSVLASEQLVDAAWLAGIGGACCAGPHLFVPTDEGVARLEVVQSAIVQTRVFAETAPLVTASDVLALSPGGLDVIRRRDALRMFLT